MKSYITIFFLLITIPGSAQIGNIIKNKIKENQKEIKDILNKEADKKQESLDSLDVIYAISFTDNSALVNITQKNEALVKGANFIFDDEESQTKEEEIREQLVLGKRFYALNKYNLALYSLLTAKAGYENDNLTNDINYFETISNLGLLYGALSRFDRAQEYTLEALKLRKKYLGSESPAYIASLNNMAVLNKDQGHFNEAESDFKTALALTAQLHGEESVQHAIVLNNLAMLYQEVGRFKEAETLMQKAIEISEKNQSKKSRNHERFLTNLAILQQVSGKYDAAEATYLHVKDLQERFFKDKHNPELGHTLTNLASLYQITGSYEKVEPLLIQAADIYEKKFSMESSTYATAISYLGNFYRGEGRYEEAEKFLNMAVEIRKRALGANHPDYNKSIEDLAILYWKKKDYIKAKTLFYNTLDKSLNFITKYFPPMSEAEKTRLWDKLDSGFDGYYAFSLEAQDQHPDVLDKLFSYRMATKALLMSSAGKLKNEIQNSGDEKLKEMYQGWLDAKESVANAYSLSLEEQKEQKIDIPALEHKANDLERQLSAKSTVFKKIITPEEWSLGNFKSKLGEKEAAIEIIRFDKIEGHDYKSTYAALVIYPGKKSQLLPIPQSELLDNRYFKYYHNAIEQKMADEHSYNAFWKAIHEAISGVNKIYFSPDGIYSQINPNTFSLPDGNYVVDKYKISILTTLRELDKAVAVEVSKDAVLLGFPDYGSASVAPLPGTREEIQQLSQLLAANSYKVTQLQGKDATESNIKKAKTPKVIHIATHGYFMEDHGSDLKGFGINPGTVADNPMLRSGLILANAASEGDQKMQGLSNNDNGLLTAYEAINLNLTGTDLVVLSACETAVGEVKAGEGVYGLQRAFVVAGAEAMLMSLWKVDDQATQILMNSFYKEWLKGSDKTSAFKKAQLNLRTQYKHPYYWGAFVMIGE